MDFIGHVEPDGLLNLGFRRALFSFPFHFPDHEGRRKIVPFLKSLLLVRAPLEVRFDLLERKIVMQERILGLGKKGVHRANQRSDGPEIRIERELDCIGFFREIEIGFQIGPAEAVDRLLGVADQVKPMFFIFAEQFPKNLELHGIGVLKLIDHGGIECISQ